MNEFFFALFILTGFLIGTLLFGHLLYFSLYSLPNLINAKPDEAISASLIQFLKRIFPLALWATITLALIIIINNFFSSYLKLFYCGLAISFIFAASEIFRKNK